MNTKPLYLFIFLIIFSCSAKAQLDTLFFKNNDIQVGQFKLDRTYPAVFVLPSKKKVIDTNALDRAFIDGKHYRYVEFSEDGGIFTFLAERVYDGQVDLYELKLHKGVFPLKPVEMVVFYFEKDGKGLQT